jgi:hypothetical protein
MSIPNSTLQAAANAMAALGTAIAVFTAAAGTTGANEASGGGYARQNTTWTDGTTGVVTGSQVEIDVAAGTYVEGGYFSALTGGTFNGSAAFSGGSVEVSGTGASINVNPSIDT